MDICEVIKQCRNLKILECACLLGDTERESERESERERERFKTAQSSAHLTRDAGVT